MSASTPVQAVSAIAPAEIASMPTGPAPIGRTGGGSFAERLLSGVDTVNQQLLSADALAQRFAVDDTIPPHQVTFALEHARLSLELALQVRARLIEGYQELMRMQL